MVAKFAGEAEGVLVETSSMAVAVDASLAVSASSQVVDCRHYVQSIERYQISRQIAVSSTVVIVIGFTFRAYAKNSQGVAYTYT